MSQRRIICPTSLPPLGRDGVPESAKLKLEFLVGCGPLIGRPGFAIYSQKRWETDECKGPVQFFFVNHSKRGARQRL